MAADIGPRIGIDGEAEFRKQINAIIQQQRTLASEAKEVASAFEDGDRSQEKFAKQAQVLARQVEAQEKRLSMLKEMLEKCREKYGEADGKTQKWQQAVHEAQAVLNRMNRELKNAQEEMNRTGEETDELGGSLEDVADHAENAGTSLGDIVKGNLIADGIGRIAEAAKSAAEETREYRKIMGSLEVSSQKAGYTAKQTADVYKTLYGVLADDQTAATTTANLQALGLAQEDLKEITDATVGAWATYGDSIPIDGLAEAINETVKTGKVTGTFADVLNWAGTSEDRFNESLEKANDQTERAKLVMQELTKQGLNRAGKAWQQNNKSLVEANRAMSDQQDALARLGEVAEPILTDIMELATGSINFIVDHGDAVKMAIAGIGSAFAGWKIADAVQGITGRLAEMTAAMGEGATMGQALTSALSGNAFGIATAGISALVGLVTAATIEFGGATDEIGELTEAASQMESQMQESRDAFAESMEKLEDSSSRLQASAEYARGLSDRLEELASTANRTGQEQEELEWTVSKLNSLFPEMGIAVDETTGSLNMGTDAVKEYIENAGKMAKMEALQEQYALAVQEVVEMELDKTEAEMKSRDITEQLIALYEKRDEVVEAAEKKQREAAEAQDEYNEKVGTGAENLDELWIKANDTSEAMVEYKGKLYTASEAMDLLNGDILDLESSQAGLDEEIEKQGEAIAGASEGMEVYEEQIKAWQGEAEKATEVQNAQNDAIQTAVIIAWKQAEAYSNLSAEEQKLAIEVTNQVLTMQENVQGALQSQMDMFAEFDAGTKLSTEKLLSNMESQIRGVEEWEQNLSGLADRGINANLLQYLADMGPKGAGYVQTFASMTDEELAAANKMWQESVDIKGMTNKWGEELLESGANNIAESMGGLEDVMEHSGDNTVMGLVRGMQKAQYKAKAEGKDLGVKTIDSINDGLGVASPSTKAKKAGEYTDEGLSLGLKAKIGIVEADAARVSEKAMQAMTRALDMGTARAYGLNLSNALAGGIRAGKSEVIEAATDVASAAITSAKRKLQIHSPSRVFWKMGENSDDAYALGMENNKRNMMARIEKVLDMGHMKGLQYTTGRGSAEMSGGRTERITGGSPIINVYAAEGQSEETIANLVMYRLQHQVAQKGAVYGG